MSELGGETYPPKALVELKYANPRYIAISMDFSVSGVNHMLELGRACKLGAAVCVQFQVGEWSIPEWCMRFESGDIVSRGIV